MTRERPKEIHCCTNCGASSLMPRTVEDPSKFRCPRCRAILGPSRAKPPRKGEKPHG